VRRIDFDVPAPIGEEEDEETLADIDEGIRDAEAGRTVPMEEVRKHLAQVDYRLLFTQRALNDLSEIVGHIARDDEETASRFGEDGERHAPTFAGAKASP
jgi:hypothetical protein